MEGRAADHSKHSIRRQDVRSFSVSLIMRRYGEQFFAGHAVPYLPCRLTDKAIEKHEAAHKRALAALGDEQRRCRLRDNIRSLRDPKLASAKRKRTTSSTFSLAAPKKQKTLS